MNDNPTTGQHWRNVMRGFFTEWETQRNDVPNPAPALLDRLRNLVVPPEESDPTEQEPPGAEILDAAREAWKASPEDREVIRNLLDEKKPQLLRPSVRMERRRRPGPHTVAK